MGVVSTKSWRKPDKPASFGREILLYDKVENT